MLKSVRPLLLSLIALSLVPAAEARSHAKAHKPAAAASHHGGKASRKQAAAKTPKLARASRRGHRVQIAHVRARPILPAQGDIATTSYRPALFAPSRGPLWTQPRYAAIVVDATTGETLYERRADMARHPASITKIMTLMLVFDAIDRGELRLDDSVPMTAEGHRQPPSKLGLRIGESIPVADAIRVIAIKSANDVAVALADRIAGNEQAFVERMNARARSLGMTGTHFANASGLPNVNHYTTARDLAALSMALFREHAREYAYFSQQYYSWRGQTMENHNHLLGRVPGVDGIKTGYTAASGYTLAASATRDGRRLIAVVLGSPSGSMRDANVTSLLDAGFTVLQSRRFGAPITVARALGEAEEGAVARSDLIGDIIGRHSASPLLPAVASQP